MEALISVSARGAVAGPTRGRRLRRRPRVGPATGVGPATAEAPRGVIYDQVLATGNPPRSAAEGVFPLRFSLAWRGGHAG